MDTIFTLSNVFALPFWLLMIFLPHWRWTQRILRSLWPVAALAVVYALLFAAQIGADAASLLNPTLASIAALLGAPAGAALAWVHFLAFDLFVGRWVYLDSREHRLPAWLVSPVLFFVLMSGPLGLLFYLAVRWFVLRRGSQA
jgi:hypothetical protein